MYSSEVILFLVVRIPTPVAVVPAPGGAVNVIVVGLVYPEPSLV